MKLFLILLTVSTAARGASVFGNLVSGVSSLGIDIGKQVNKMTSDGVVTGVTAVKDTGKVTTDIGKLAVIGTAAVTSKLVNNSADVANDAIGVIDIIGKHMGSLGKPVEGIGMVGHDTVEIGVDLANKGIDKVQEVGVDTLSAVDGVVSEGSNLVINATKSGQAMVDGALDKINQRVSSLFG